MAEQFFVHTRARVRHAIKFCSSSFNLLLLACIFSTKSENSSRSIGLLLLRTIFRLPRGALCGILPFASCHFKYRYRCPNCELEDTLFFARASLKTTLAGIVRLWHNRCLIRRLLLFFPVFVLLTVQLVGGHCGLPSFVWTWPIDSGFDNVVSKIVKKDRRTWQNWLGAKAGVSSCEAEMILRTNHLNRREMHRVIPWCRVRPTVDRQIFQPSSNCLLLIWYSYDLALGFD